MTEINATCLRTLMDRIYGGKFDQVLTMTQPDAWLEAFLAQWVADEDMFFSISLEKEEFDM
jgi:hypothetical protein